MKAKNKRNVRGKSGDPNRGTWCTAERVAEAVGAFDVDPFSNPRSHVQATHRCMLEDGGDGFGDGVTPGSYRVGGGDMIRYATEETLSWIQPDYRLVQRVLDHWMHTRFVALLRFDPRPDWFKRIYRRSQLVCVLWECEFEPPPGVTPSSNTFPHALFYANAADVTDAVLRMTITWRTNRGS